VRPVSPVWECLSERNLLEPHNVARVASTLQSPNIIVGFHYFYYGGRGPDLLAYSALEPYLERVNAARPGDAFTFYSLQPIIHNALLVIGRVDSQIPLDRLEDRLRPVVSAVAAKKEIVAVWRADRGDGIVACEAEILWDLTPEEWTRIQGKWSTRTGEMSFLDIKVLYEVENAGHKARDAKEELPVGLAADGKRPDDRGLTPTGGAY
jgi:hypothetical protein